MDLDAELAKLQEEARRELATRRPAPAPSEEELTADSDPTLEPAAPELPPVPWPDALRQADRLRTGLGAGLGTLEGKAAQARRLPFKAKVGLAVVGVAAVLAAWHFVLAPLLSILLTVGVLALIVYALVHLFGSGDDADLDEP